MPDPVFVRVKDRDTKHEYSVVDSAVDPEFHEVLKDKDAVSTDGTPLPPKHHILSSRSSTSGHKADTKKEGS